MAAVLTVITDDGTQRQIQLGAGVQLPAGVKSAADQTGVSESDIWRAYDAARNGA